MTTEGELRVVVRHREHRTYDPQMTHSSDEAGDRFVCGWCGGWGHVAGNDGRPKDCAECAALGWYVNA